MNSRHLDDALRALPRREGRSDWNDLESRIAALKPMRPARRVTARRFALAGGSLAVVLGGVLLAWSQLAERSDATWQQAHQDATSSDPWADPWVAAAVETSR